MEQQPAPVRTVTPAVPAPGVRRRPRAAAGAALLGVALLAGCGVRLEAPPADEPVPDSLEVVRRTAVSDALLVADGAEAALEEAPTERERLVTELTRIAAASRAQAEALGGEYDSGLATDEPSGTQSSAWDRATPADVVQALDDAAARSRTAAGTTTDGPLARLLASIGAAQTVSGERLAAIADVPGPGVAAPRVPTPTGSGRAAEEGTPAPTEPTEDAAGTDQDDGQDDVRDEGGTVPEGLTAHDLSTLVVSEDATRFAQQLRAAITSGTKRDRLLDRVEAHAQRADAWAAVAGTQATAQDPRRAAYAVPRLADQGDKALVIDLENDLATDYASLVGTTTAGTRGVLVDLLVDAAVTLDDWGAEPEPFPGLPEQAGDEVGA
ncbi:DUF4439 domain-containing protein [Krasilnikoviella flava]|uniref:DUF4439 domain-containing protein n=1 Tax=Krasilnikoviella flava TaxID=526729 RepID=A0A1T5LTM8_9MICO|nr:DUF4439 domain-containing protein [Krasilnikoviella flava]SKC78898.1 protein of unknown function [Krasilnikoviella flava]